MIASFTPKTGALIGISFNKHQDAKNRLQMQTIFCLLIHGHWLRHFRFGDDL